MKHFTKLYPRLYSYENLLLAYKKVKKGSRINRERAVCFFHLENRLLEIQDSLITKSYTPDSYRYFQVRPQEKNGICCYRKR